MALCFAVPPTVVQISYKAAHLLMYNLANVLITVEVKVEVSDCECESFRPQLNCF